MIGQREEFLAGSENFRSAETAAAETLELERSDGVQDAAEEKRSNERYDIAQGLAQIEREIEAIANAAEAIRSASFARKDYEQYANAIASCTRRIHDIAANLKDPRDDRGIYHETGNSG
jgi:hypothetical protein